MASLNKAYNGLRGFVSDFANSTTGSCGSSSKVENRKAWYAEWDDNYMGSLLDNYLVKTVLRKIADSYYGRQLDAVLEQSTPLDANSFPLLYDIYEQCCDTLGMYDRPRAYVTGKMKDVNALSVEVKGNRLILVSPKVAVSLIPEEQMFILGHEISHHQQGNLVCHTVNGLIDHLNNASEIFGPIVLDTIEVPLKRWCRRSEFNADRGGYLCCRRADVIEQLFLRLGRQEAHSAYAEYKELGTAHPMMLTRWNVLKQFIEAYNL